MRWIALLPGVLVFGLSRLVLAQADASSKAAAEALFAAARTLAAAGNYAEACPKFEASEKLDAGVGTMLNLAECYDKLGRTASAWAQYREAMARAHASHATDREDFAREHATELARRLSTLTIRADTRATGVAISRDGATLDAAELGIAIPLDPGKHRVEAAAPQRKPWSTDVVVNAGAGNVTVDVPVLEPLPAPPALTPVQVPRRSSAATPRVPPGRPDSVRRPVAIGVAVGGGVALGVGVFFGLTASSDWSEAKAACTGARGECPGAAVEKRHHALTEATVSTVAFVAGGAAVALGAVLWFTTPSGPSVAVGPGSILAMGRF